MKAPTFIGLRNLTRLIGFHVDVSMLQLIRETGKNLHFWKFIKANDPYFWLFLWNNFFFMLSIVLGMIVSLILAFAVNLELKGIVIYRTVYYLPVVTSMVAVAMVWQWLFHTNIGIVNTALSWINIKGPPWLSHTKWARWSIIFLLVWKRCGYNMLIYLAGLKGIPSTYYESAHIDGANWWQKARYITMPLLTPTHFFVLVIGFIWVFQIFDVIFIMTQGGPVFTTSTLAWYIYDEAFNNMRMGYAAAISWVVFLIIFGLTLLQWNTRKKWVFGEE